MGFAVRVDGAASIRHHLRGRRAFPCSVGFRTRRARYSHRANWRLCSAAPDSTVGHALGWGWAASLAAALGVAARHGGRLGRALLVGLGVWVCIYLVVRFQVAEPPAPLLAVPGSCRYGAPLYPLAFGLLAVAGGVLWARGWRGATVGLLAIPLIAGLGARVETLRHPFPALSVWRMHAVDWPYFRNHSYVVSPEDHLNPTTTDPFSLRAHAYGAARETASGLLRDEQYSGDLRALPVRPDGLPARGWWQGVGDAPGSFHQNRLDGTLTILRTSRALLDDTPGATRPQLGARCGALRRGRCMRGRLDSLHRSSRRGHLCVGARRARSRKMPTWPMLRGGRSGSPGAPHGRMAPAVGASPARRPRRAPVVHRGLRPCARGGVGTARCGEAPPGDSRHARGERGICPGLAGWSGGPVVGRSTSPAWCGPRERAHGARRCWGISRRRFGGGSPRGDRLVVDRLSGHGGAVARNGVGHRRG